MPMNRESKESMVTELSDKLSRAKAAVIADFAGLDVAAVNEIRDAFREIGVEYKVVKNSLMKRALIGTPIEALGASFKGPTAVAFKFDEEFGLLGKTAKAMVAKHEKFEVKAAYIEEDILTENIVATMAALPTLDEARAQLLGVFNAPASQLLAIFNAPGSNLLSVIKAKQEKDEEGEAA
jgi:large subunit ribosomal protein L10